MSLKSILFNNQKVDNNTDYQELFSKMITKDTNIEQELITLTQLISENKLNLNEIKLVELKQDILLNHFDNLKYGNNTKETNYYPKLTNKQFNDIIYKTTEFNKYQIKQTQTNNKNKKQSIEFKKSSTQKLLSNYVNPKTPYNGLLIWHEVGVGKTCSALSIAENFREEAIQTGKKILILLPGQKLKESWLKEIFNFEKQTKTKNKKINVQCTGKYYTNKYKEFKKKYGKQKAHKKIQRLIHKIYEFKGYQEFAGIIEKELEDNRKYKSIENIESRLIQIVKEQFRNKIIILDEVHEIRDSSSDESSKKSSYYLEKIARYSENTKFIMLTATPIFNEISDMIWLLNLLLLNDHRGKIFENESNNHTFLKKKITGYISYLKSSNLSDFPVRLYPHPKLQYYRLKNGEYSWTKKEKQDHISLLMNPQFTKKDNILLCKNVMSDFQKKRYEMTINNQTNKAFGFLGSDELLIGLTDYELGEGGNKKNYILNQIPYLTKNDDEQYQYNSGNPDVILNDKSFLHNERISKYSIKYYNLLHLIKQSSGPIFINSRRVHPGVKLIAMMLEENGMKRHGGSSFLQSTQSKKHTFFKNMEYIYIDGSIRNVDELVSYFNYNDNNKIKVILGTDAISQGINLFRMREVHIMEPWFNLNKTEQIIGRATRKISHKTLLNGKPMPFSEQNVTIYLHISVFENDNKTRDYENYKISFTKKQKEVEFLNFIKTITFDCELNKLGNYTIAKKEVKITDAQNQQRTIKKGNKCNILGMNLDLQVYEKQQFCSKNQIPPSTEKIKTICNINKSTKLKNTTFKLSNQFEDEIQSIIIAIKSLLLTDDKYVYSFSTLKKLLKIKIEDRNLLQSLKIIEKDKMIFINNQNTQGILIQKKIKKNLFWVFQPLLIQNTNIPIQYRYLPLSKYNFEFFNLNEISKQLSQKKNKTQSLELLQILTNYKISNVYEKFNKKKKKKFFITYETIQIDYDKIFKQFEKTNIKQFEKNLNGNFQKEFPKLINNKSIPPLKQLLNKYYRFYYLDRVTLSEKKQLLEFLIDYLYFNNTTTIEKSKEFIFEYDIPHLFDFFSQKIGYGNLQTEMKPLYLIKYENNYYYRLIQINKKDKKWNITNEYFKAEFKNNKLTFKKDESLPLTMDITYKDYFQDKRFIYDYVQFFGKLSRNTKTKEYSIVKFQDNLVKTKGKRCEYGDMFYKGEQYSVIEQTRNSLIDILQSLFIEDTEFIKANIINKIETEFKDSGFLNKQCLYNEVFLRLYRDCVQNLPNNNPQYWFFNGDETKLFDDPNFTFKNQLIIIFYKNYNKIIEEIKEKAKECNKNDKMFLNIYIEQKKKNKKEKIKWIIVCDKDTTTIDENFIEIQINQTTDPINLFNYPINDI